MENMILSELQNYIKNQLAKKFSPGEVRSITIHLLRDGLQINQTALYTNPGMLIGREQFFNVENWVSAILNNVPLQYVLGFTWFYNCRINLNPDVLIPRPETEELVGWILEQCQESILNVHDLCTGSGCIAVALKKERPRWTVSGSDLSLPALETARKNGINNGLDLDFTQINVLENDFNFDASVIVSNPPYVTEGEKVYMLPNVLEFEPHLALFVPDNDPLLFYRHIAHKAKKSLSSGGLLFFEINENYGLQCIEMLENMHYENCTLKKDMSGKDRFIKARKI